MNKQKIIFLFILVLSTFPLFSQDNHKIRAVVKDSILLNRLDDSVDYYENAGIDSYHHSKFDTAIRKFRKAKHYIDTLSTMREKLSDHINSLVTKCNIGICDTKLHKWGKALKEIPYSSDLLSPQKLHDITAYHPTDWRTYYTKILAFLQFTEGDCYREHNLKTTLGCYFDAYLNLRWINHGSTDITYKYAVKSYLLKKSYGDTVSRGTLAGDTVNTSLYVNILNQISKDK